MSSFPSWAILIPTIPQRAEKFERLAVELCEQIDDHADWRLGQRVKIVAWLNEGQPRLAEIRDRMVRYALAQECDYVSFVDDDDHVSNDYVWRILAALATRPDHVGFKLRYTKDGEPIYAGGVEHRLGYGQWGYNPATCVLYRDFTHLDPIRTELAARGRFALAPRYTPEDRRWVDQVRPHLRSEVFIDHTLYHYDWRPKLSSWDRPLKPVGLTARPRYLDHISLHLLWHPESL